MRSPTAANRGQQRPTSAPGTVVSVGASGEPTLPSRPCGRQHARSHFDPRHRRRSVDDHGRASGPSTWRRWLCTAHRGQWRRRWSPRAPAVGNPVGQRMRCRSTRPTAGRQRDPIGSGDPAEHRSNGLWRNDCHAPASPPAGDPMDGLAAIPPAHNTSGNPGRRERTYDVTAEPGGGKQRAGDAARGEHLVHRRLFEAVQQLTDRLINPGDTCDGGGAGNDAHLLGAVARRGLATTSRCATSAGHPCRSPERSSRACPVICTTR